MTKFINASLCDVSNAVKRYFALLALSLICYSTGFGQLADLEVDDAIESGILYEINNQNDLGVIQFKIDDFTDVTALLIVRELTKYEGEINGLGMSVADHKLIVSYRDPMEPNFILAILDRINIRAFYDFNGQDIYFVKDGRSEFLR